MQRNKTLVLSALLAFICLFGPVYAAVSSGEAVKLITEENRFLLDNEEAKQPNYKFLHHGKPYWVIPVVVEEDPVAYFAVSASEKELVTDGLTNRALFKASDFLREFLREKERASKNTQVTWLVTSKYARVFDSLSRLIADEVFELNTIATTADDPKISSMASTQKSSLGIMSDLAEEISASIDEATSFESEFTTTPDTAKVEEFQKKFAAVFGALFQLEDKALDYRSKIAELKRLISLSEAEPDAKSYMIKLADPPENFNEIGNLALSGKELQEVMDKLGTRVDARLDGFVNEFTQRLERNKAYTYLYGANPEVPKAMAGYSDLRSAALFILKPENKSAWLDQAGLNRLDDSWRNAENSYKKADYAKALIYGADSLKYAKQVLGKGVVKIEDKPLFSDQLLQQLVLGLGGLLILIFLFKNRGKLGGLLSPGQAEDGEKIDLGWRNA